jgi:hypothetical protein
MEDGCGGWFRMVRDMNGSRLAREDGKRVGGGVASRGGWEVGRRELGSGRSRCDTHRHWDSWTTHESLSELSCFSLKSN